MKKILLFLSFLFLFVWNIYGIPTKCTSTSDLTAGEVYYISAASSYSSSANVMAKSTTDGSNNFPQTTFAGSPVELTLGGTSGAWTFSYKDGNTTYYLNTTSTTGSNVLRRKTTNDNYGKFTISFSNGAAVITCTGKSSRNIVRYNSSSSCYSCYTSGQAAVYLYKKVSDYTITVQSNNNSYGTVSLAGTTITATPNSGYIISGSNPYTISSGTATVTNNGDGTFSVTPTSNCTIIINFDAIQQHIVNWYNGTTLIHSQTDYDGTAFTNPGTLTSSDCDGVKSFVGWTRIVNYTSETTAPDDLFSYTADSLINRDVNYYAVFASIGSGGSGFKLSLTNNSVEYYVGAKGSGSFLLAPTDESSAAVFEYDNGQLYYDDSGTKKYISSEGNNTTLNVQTSPTTATWTESGTATVTYQSSATGNRYLGFNNSADPKRFAPYGSTYPHSFTKHSVASYENYSTICEVIDVTGVVLNESSITLYPNETFQLVDTIKPTNASDKVVTWVSNNTDIATVDENGLVTAIAEGTTTITCTTHDGSFTAICAVNVLGKPIIDIARWDTNAVYIDIDNFNAVTGVLENQNTQAEINQHYADSLFFSKYFEAASNVKLLAIYNGTDHDIDIADYGYAKATNGGAFTTTLFSAFVRTDEEPFNTLIESNHELILIAYHDDDKSDSVIIKCAQDNIHSGYENYVRISSPAIDFNGDDAVALVNPQGNFIDLIGAGTKTGGGVKGTDFRSCNKSGASGGDCDGFMDNPGGWFSNDGINLHTNDSNYALATNRCLLVRKKRVTSGLDAVEKNTTTFVTLGGLYGEWRGIQMPGGSPNTADGEGTRNSCNGFDDVGTFDYNDYYIDYDTIVSEQELSAKEEDGTYKIEISQLDTLSCTNLKVIVKDETGHSAYDVFKIPIMVAEDTNTKSELFRKEKGDCPTCDVVIMHNAKLTVDSTMTSRNVKVYEGSILNVKSEQTYTLTSLSLRKTDDTNPYLTLNGNISLAGDSSFYLDIYTDPSEWRWLVLPDTFDIRNITLSNGKHVNFNEDYLIKTYSGYIRATQQKNGWTPVTSNKVFMPGEGFIFGIAGDGTIKKEFRFKFANNILTKEKANKTLDWTSLQSWGCNDSELRPNHKGWNLVGNAFLDKLTTEIYDPIGIGRLVHSDTDPWDGKWDIEPGSTGKLRYRVIHERNSAGEDGNGYSSELLDDVQLEPFSTFFIQLGGNEETRQTILLKTEKRRNMMRRMIETVDEDDELFLRVFVGNKKTGMFISNKFTEDYEPGDDLESRQSIYQNIGGYKLLYSAINDSIIENGVLVNSPAGHLYLDPKVNIDKFEEINIFYNNNWYDLLHGQTVDIEAGSFILQAKRKQNDIPTNINTIKSTNGLYKFSDGKNIYINKNGEIYNVLGTKVK